VRGETATASLRGTVGERITKGGTGSEWTLKFTLTYIPSAGTISGGEQARITKDETEKKSGRGEKEKPMLDLWEYHPSLLLWEIMPNGTADEKGRAETREIDFQRKEPCPSGWTGTKC